MKRYQKIILSSVGTASIVFGGLGSLVVDAQINPYQDKGTSLEMQEVSTLPEMGKEDFVAEKNSPKITMKKFNNELSMGVTYQGLPANTTGSRPFLSKNVEWSDANQKMQVVPLAASSAMEDGGYEINIILNSKPASNVFNFSIDGAENLDFFYQPALTNQEIKEGASRPDNVVGSYAVYYKNHANHIVGQTNYATGKAYHIFRPKVTDNAGNSVWGDLSYVNGVLTLNVSQSFLDSASYPVTVDPTFGFTTQGASGTLIYSSGGGDAWEGTTYNLSTGGTVTALNAWVQNAVGSNNFRPYIYTDGGTGPTTFQVAGAITAISSASYTNQTVSVSKALNTGNFYLGVGGDGGLTSANVAADLTGATGDSCVTGNWNINTAPPDPWACTGGHSATTRKISVYATYTASAPANTANQIIINNAAININNAAVVDN